MSHSITFEELIGAAITTVDDPDKIIGEIRAITFGEDLVELSVQLYPEVPEGSDNVTPMPGQRIREVFEKPLPYPEAPPMPPTLDIRDRPISDD